MSARAQSLSDVRIFRLLRCTGVDDEDERQLQWLLDGLASAKDRVTVVRYPHIAGHHVSGSLKESGELKPLVQREILAAAAVAVP